MEEIFRINVTVPPEEVKKYLSRNTRECVPMATVPFREWQRNELMVEVSTLSPEPVLVGTAEGWEAWIFLLPSDKIRDIDGAAIFSFDGVRREIPITMNDEGSSSPLGPQAIIEAYGSALIGKCKHKEWFGKYVDSIGAELGRVFGESINTVKLKQPSKPDKSASLDDWYDYYHACHEAGIKKTLEDIAKVTNFSISHLKNNHKNYKLRRGIE